MSKLKETFDGIEVREELKRDVMNRIKRDKKTVSDRHSEHFSKKPKTGLKVALITTAAVLAVIMILPSYLVISHAVGNPAYNFGKALPVKTESRLTALLNKEEYAPLTLFGMPRMFSAVEDSGNAEQSDSGVGLIGAAAHSSTNVQVEGVDEGDIIKNDGRYIYRLAGSGFNITEANDGQLSEVCSVPIDNFAPIEMYISGSLLVLIGGGCYTVPDYGIDDLKGGGYMNCLSYHTNVQIRVFDLTDITAPAQTRFYQIEGYYNTSRVNEEDETLYFVVNYYNYYYGNYYGLGADAGYARRPYYRDSEDAPAEVLPVEDIYYFKNVPNKSYMMLGAIDLRDPLKEADVKAYLSCANIIYVSGENIYISTYQYFYDIFGGVSDTTYIAKFSLSDLGYKGSGKVKGTPKDRYCLDEYNGYLRVAATYNDWSLSGNAFASAVYVFDGDMKEVSRLTGIAPGEAIDSAAFSGDKGYISTSVRMTDPLFIIDFSDVKHPVISSGLKESGISNYLKAVEGTDYVIGFGTDSGAGVKVQLYDMSGDEAVSVEKLVIEGNCSYAEVLYNPKALLYMYDKETKTGIIGFAAEQAEYSYYGGYQYRIRRQGLFLYAFDAAAGELKELRFLSNFDTDKDVYTYSHSSYNYEDTLIMYSEYVKRGIIIGNYIYTVADSAIAAYSLEDFARTAVLAG